jgi:hypothetical protein
MPLHIGIVLNPHARRASAARLLERLGRAAQVGEGAVETSLRVTAAEAELPAVVAELAERRTDVLAVCGGDGTMLATVSAAIETYAAKKLPLPPFLILPGGTMNTVAKNLGCSDGRTPEAGLLRLVETLAGDGRRGLSRVPRFEQPVMQVTTFGEGHAAESRTRYGCIFSAAMGARYLTEYARRPGLLWALWLGLRTIGSSFIPGGGRFARWLFQRTAAELVADGEAIAEAAFRLLICATVPDVGLGMRVPWRAGCVPRRFHLIASSLPLIANALQLGRMQRGQPLLGSPHTDRMAADLAVRFFEPQPLTLDGELFSATAVRITVGPTLTVLLP